MVIALFETCFLGSSIHQEQLLCCKVLICNAGFYFSLSSKSSHQFMPKPFPWKDILRFLTHLHMYNIKYKMPCYVIFWSDFYRVLAVLKLSSFGDNLLIGLQAVFALFKTLKVVFTIDFLCVTSQMARDLYIFLKYLNITQFILNCQIRFVAYTINVNSSSKLCYQNVLLLHYRDRTFFKILLQVLRWETSMKDFTWTTYNLLCSSFCVINQGGN